MKRLWWRLRFHLSRCHCRSYHARTGRHSDACPLYARGRTP